MAKATVLEGKQHGAAPAARPLAAARDFYSCLPVTQSISSRDGIRMAFDHSAVHNCLAFITRVLNGRFFYVCFCLQITPDW